MTERKTDKITDVLPSFTSTYNNTFHTSIKMAPSKVTKYNSNQVWNTLFSDLIKRGASGKSETPKFEVGDLVRISRAKLTFEKGEF